jgi:hypothetical protein
MAPATGTPTGSVTFKDGTTTIGTINLNAKSPDVAAFTTSALSVKSHSITADYLGATGTTAYAGSNSALLSQVVSAASTTTALSPPAGPLVSGQPITLTATVAVTTPGSGTPTGSVTFKDGTTTLGTSNLNGLAADVATYTTSTKLLASGSPHSLTATYSASTSDLGSVSKPVSLTVGLSGTTTAFTVTPPQPWVSGQALTILATVAPLAPGTGTPTGTVTFYNGSTKLGSGTLNKAATDQTTFVAKLPAPATNSLTAVYAGDTNYNTSTTTNVIEPVAPAQTTTVLQSSKNPSVNGQPVTFTATVTVKSPGSGTPTGQVTFTNGSTTLGTGTLGANGVATYATSTLSVGAAHTITATYGGDANDAASLPSTALSQVVNADPTNTTISSSANPSVIGQPVTFTATVAAAAPGAGIPSGTVTFNLGTSTLTGTLNGKTPDQATVTTSSLPFGTAQSITATYGTDGDFASSTSAALAQTINAAQTVTTVTSSKNPSPSGTPVTYTATVAAKAPGAGTPTGTVTFEDGTTVLCSPVPLGTQGATCVESAFTQPGSHTITATFSSATKSFVASTGSLTQVNQGPTTTALTSTPNPSVSGQSVTYTATVKVSAGTGAPTGQVSFYDGTTLLGTGALNGASTDAATFSTGFAVFGTSSITATYAGSASFTASTSPVLTQTVHPAGTTTAVSAAPNPSVSGQSVTLTATVAVTAPGTGAPAGTVDFYDGTTLLGTGSLNGLSPDTATFSVGLPAAGSPHQISATYVGTAAYATSTSGKVAEIVTKSATTTTLSAPSSTSVSGEHVTYSAMVAPTAPGTGTASGTVAFFEAGTAIPSCSARSLTSGVATCSLTYAGPGPHAITAVYSGDSNFTISTSGPLAHSVNQAATTTALTSDTSPSVIGQSVTFTATVTATTPGAGTPTGTVSFFDGTTSFGTGTLAGGVATFTTSSLSVASHPVTAVYEGDTDFTTSTSNPALTQTVNQDATSASVTSATSPSVFGQSVTFTATVTPSAPGAGTPTGTVSFFDGTTSLGTGTLDASGVATSPPTAGLSVGDHAITAVYDGDTDFTASTSAAFTQTVNQGATSTSVTGAPGPSVFGQSVTFTATVTPSAPGAGTPTGTVEFFDGTTSLGTGTLTAGVATFTTSSLSVASHPVTAVYEGDTDFTTSTSTAFSQTVDQAATATSLSINPSPSVFGQSVTFTATVTPSAPGAGTPTGTVSFFDGTTSLGSGTLTAGVATFSTAALSVGVLGHPITATYDGDTDFTTSTSTPATTQVVDQAATSTSVTGGPSPSVIGQSVTFTATVTATTPGAGTPTGTVSFFDGTTSFGTGTLAGGVATFTTSSLSVASHPVTAVYEGDTDFTTSTSNPALTQTVNQDATSASVTSATSPSVFGQSVTFTATVTPSAPGAGTPTGTVSFFDGTTSLGTGTLDASGVATSPPTAGLSVGDHAITAVYDGDTDFTASTSAAFTQTVNQGATSTSVTGAPGPSVFGQSVTFTATVTPSAPGAGTPTGTVEFFDGTTSLGTGTLTAGVATFTTSSLSVASHPVTAVYEGDTDFTTSTSTAFSQTVGKASTDTFVFSSSPSLAGQSVTFDVTVLAKGPGAGFPTGGVTLYENGTAFSCGPSGLVVLDGSGKGTCSTTYPLPGAYAITASYPGDPNFLASTSGQSPTQTVNRDQTGYSVVAGNGALFTYGDATSFGTVAPSQLNKPLIGLVKTPDEQGYWEVAADGGVFTFGDARFYGSMGGQHLNAPVVGFASTPDGKGYWEVASDGGIFAFGDAHFYGSMGGQHLNRPVVGIASTPSGNGYWEVASDGGVFAFGDAAPHGNTVGIHLNSPIVGIAATPDGTGYWLVGADGGVFAEGSATFYGSMAGKPLNRPVVGILATPNGKGYWLVGADGGVFDFGGAGFFSDPALPVSGAPIIGIG